MVVTTSNLNQWNVYMKHIFVSLIWFGQVVFVFKKSDELSEFIQTFFLFLCKMWNKCVFLYAQKCVTFYIMYLPFLYLRVSYEETIGNK